jgi:hypothetical protein
MGIQNGEKPTHETSKRAVNEMTKTTSVPFLGFDGRGVSSARGGWQETRAAGWSKRAASLRARAGTRQSVGESTGDEPTKEQP